MHLEGETEIAAPRARAWATLTDPHKVAECVSGDVSIEVLDERNFRVTAEVTNGFLRAPVTVEIELTELAEPERARATATAAIMASPVVASGSLLLDELAPGRTRAAWSAEVTLGGMLGGFGGLVQAPVEKAVDRTLQCLKARIEAESAGGQPDPAI